MKNGHGNEARETGDDMIWTGCRMGNGNENELALLENLN